MEQIAEHIAQQKIAEALPEIKRSAYISAYNDVVGALEFDVTSAVSIGLENCGTIFYDSKTQKVLAEAVMRETRKRLSGNSPMPTRTPTSTFSIGLPPSFRHTESLSKRLPKAQNMNTT